ncbi:MAG TPA: polyprenyl synthetase family protein [Spirochaetota bacterium]|jgi:octaprenyl-diphosphate synthase|nr:polyprenyl synthetase family protein [Spirochaetota bacterium]HOQ10800.1 polyprenyl synthetase family protein [Spirochaetota bacterium]HPD78679.1 polyprenyl synthetase family protein [Spirochaetota bacterium]HRS63133.1 polyprenyl synthetase family protein [Spirochaetota bacterium]HRU66240.1 polyprenyl synthetase family protein [Spirochaetota bacterium]
MADKLKEILSPVSEELAKVDINIKKNLETGVPLIDKSALHLFAKGGKKIRASLVILSAAMGGEVTERVIELAAAVEIIHAASLVHDDIIDKSFLRRGDLSVPSKFGDKVAVLAGDYMYLTAVGIAVDNSNKKILKSLSKATREMVQGELYQLEYSNIDKITQEHYYNIINRKTAQLMAASAFIGGAEVGFDDNRCNALYSMGLDLGYAFQIVDDTLDFSESSEVTGKDIGNDFKDGKITLPFIYILNSGDEADRSKVMDFYRSPDDADFAEIKDLIHRSGAFDFSLAKAREFAQRSKDWLDIFESSIYKDIIIEIINFVVERNY